jgi:hypothetical protein
MLNNNPCTSVEASVGGGANLDTLESVVRVMKAMQERGYSLEDIPESGAELIKTIMGRKALSDFRWTTTGEIVNKGGALDLVSKELYESWFAELPEDLRTSIIENWGEPVGEGMVHDGKLLVTGVRFGNTIVCAQPKRGCMGSKCDGSSCKILHDPHIPPTHQYLATYRWLERVFGADVLILPEGRGAKDWDDTLLKHHTGEVLRGDESLQICWEDAKISVYSSWNTETSNESSLCVLFQTQKCAILITGDRSGFGERMLLRSFSLPDVDILVAGHHGSVYSTTEDLLDAVTPETVLISVSEDNNYGHPAPELLQRLEARGCTVYRTDEHGTITLRR